MAGESSRTDPTRQATSALLSNGVRMPLVGYGCAGRIGRKPLAEALELGYALFDTSQASEWYLEEELGVALAMSSVNRSAVFLTSKLHPRDLGEQSTLRALPASLRNLQTSTIDAFLLHYPRCFGDLCGGREPEGTWRESWRALESLYEQGQVRALGVSNFSPGELQQLLGFARTPPHIVQSWMDPLHQERPLREVCRAHGILFQAYSTLGTQWAGRGVRVNPVLRHPVLGAVAAEVGRSTAQVALRWALQHGVAVIPRSTKRRHMAEGLDLFGFDLSAAQMASIDSLAAALHFFFSLVVLVVRPRSTASTAPTRAPCTRRPHRRGRVPTTATRAARGPMRASATLTRARSPKCGSDGEAEREAVG